MDFLQQAIRSSLAIPPTQEKRGEEMICVKTVYKGQKVKVVDLKL